MRFPLLVPAALIASAVAGDVRAACSGAPGTTPARSPQATEIERRSFAFLHVTSDSAIPGLALADLVATVPRPARLTGSALVTVAALDDPTGACLYRVEEVRDGAVIMEIMENIAARDGTVSILRTFDGDALRFDTLGRARTFRSADLSVRGGMLRHRTGAFDTDLGTIFAAAPGF